MSNSRCASSLVASRILLRYRASPILVLIAWALPLAGCNRGEESAKSSSSPLDRAFPNIHIEENLPPFRLPAESAAAINLPKYRYPDPNGEEMDRVEIVAAFRFERDSYDTHRPSVTSGGSIVENGEESVLVVIHPTGSHPETGAACVTTKGIVYVLHFSDGSVDMVLHQIVAPLTYETKDHREYRALIPGGVPLGPTVTRVTRDGNVQQFSTDSRRARDVETATARFYGDPFHALSLARENGIPSGDCIWDVANPDLWQGTVRISLVGDCTEEHLPFIAIIFLDQEGSESHRIEWSHVPE